MKVHVPTIPVRVYDEHYNNEPIISFKHMRPSTFKVSAYFELLSAREVKSKRKDWELKGLI